MEEIARFLHEHPPFSLLSYEHVLSIAEHIQIEYFPVGKDVLVHDGQPSAYLYIIRRGSVDMLRHDEQGTQIYDTYGEGEIFGQLSLIRKKPPLLTVRTREETLAYLLPARIFEKLLREHSAWEQFFARSTGERLDSALRQHQDRSTSELFRLRMKDLMREPLLVEPYTNIRRAAQMMSEMDTSCAVVMTTPVGIMSDRDLRNRVVAQGLPDSAHVARVMTSPVLTLPADSLAFECLMLMIERNIHHVPVSEDGKIIGVVTHTDLLRQQSRSPLLLPRVLERAESAEDLHQYMNQVESTAGGLLQAGGRISDIGRLVAIAHDALIRRLVSEAERSLGKPPCDYAWLVLGSEGRLEQTLRTDQDNALVYADDAPQWADVYFKDMAEHVVGRLVECGFPLCPGGIMATNPQWRQRLRVWKNYFDDWIKRPDEHALLRSAIFFDYRRVSGALDVEAVLRPVIEAGRGQRIFLARLARVALRQSPPLGFFRNFVLEREGSTRDLLDLKGRGSALIVDLARLYALEAGSAETNTLARLRLSASQSSLDQASAEELAAAFELINLFRMRHQYGQLQRGEAPTNMVPVSGLSKMEQRDLKEAMRAIEMNQRSVESTFQTGLLG